MTSALNGLKVIEMGHFVAVPAACAMLADLGADVIKVEPLDGDALRYQHVMKEDLTPDFEGVPWRFELHNRNKKSIAIDLNRKSGIEVLYKMVTGADIFVSNYEQSSLNKFQLDYPTLSKLNPGLIYGSLTGYGTTGPDRNERGFDFTAAWARTGVQYLLGATDSPPPQSRPGIMDRVAGITIVAGLMAGLVSRDRSGKGMELAFSLYQTGIWTQAMDLQSALSGNLPRNNDCQNITHPLINAYRTKDNRWIQLAMIQAHFHWDDLCKAIDRPDLLTDERFQVRRLEIFSRHKAELKQILNEVFAKRTLEEWAGLLRKNNCIFSPVSTPQEVINDPQARSNDFFLAAEHPWAGRIELVNTPINVVGDPTVIKNTAPEVGQDTEQILLDLDYSWEDIARLKDEETIL